MLRSPVPRSRLTRRRGILEGVDGVAAVSVGVIDGKNHLDLDYALDSNAQVDMNIAMNHKNQFIEVQGTAENHPFDQRTLDTMMELARDGIARLIEKQRELLGDGIGKG